MRPLILCRERLERLLSVLDQQGGSETLRQLVRRFAFFNWEVTQAADLGWLEIEIRKPRVGRPSRIAHRLNKCYQQNYPPWRSEIEREISIRHGLFAKYSVIYAVKGGSRMLGMQGLAGAYAMVYRGCKTQASRDAACSRLLRHPGVRAARQWYYAIASQEIPQTERMPQTASGIWRRLRELGNWRARCDPKR